MEQEQQGLKTCKNYMEAFKSKKTVIFAQFAICAMEHRCIWIRDVAAFYY
ncbi:hypothetical protein GCM10020331_057850 [Ectobacillus funiculus]